MTDTSMPTPSPKPTPIGYVYRFRYRLKRYPDPNLHKFIKFYGPYPTADAANEDRYKLCEIFQADPEVSWYSFGIWEIYDPKLSSEQHLVNVVRNPLSVHEPAVHAPAPLRQ